MTIGATGPKVSAAWEGPTSTHPLRTIFALYSELELMEHRLGSWTRSVSAPRGLDLCCDSLMRQSNPVKVKREQAEPTIGVI